MKAFKAFIVLAMIIPYVLFEGLAISILWRWFVVPVFHCPLLAVTTAAGIACIVGIMVLHAPAQLPKQGTETEGDREWFIKLISSCLRPAMFLGVGYMLKLISGL